MDAIITVMAENKLLLSASQSIVSHCPDWKASMKVEWWSPGSHAESLFSSPQNNRAELSWGNKEWIENYWVKTDVSWRIIPVAVFIITIGWGPGAQSQLSQVISTGHSTTLETQASALWNLMRILYWQPMNWMLMLTSRNMSEKIVRKWSKSTYDHFIEGVLTMFPFSMHASFLFQVFQCNTPLHWSLKSWILRQTWLVQRLFKSTRCLLSIDLR